MLTLWLFFEMPSHPGAMEDLRCRENQTLITVASASPASSGCTPARDSCQLLVAVTALYQKTAENW